MVERIASLALGYIFGMFLTADIVARLRTDKGARALGSGNPGMANIGSTLGAGWAALTLAGDILKTVIPCAMSYLAFGPALGSLAVLWAGLGAVLGHNYPASARFHGGKGVTATCAVLVIFNPPWGILALAAGLAVTVASRYLCIGAVAIPFAFAIFEVLLGADGEVVFLCMILAILMFIAHAPAILRAIDGTEPRTDLLAKVRGLHDRKDRR